MNLLLRSPTSLSFSEAGEPDCPDSPSLMGRRLPVPAPGLVTGFLCDICFPPGVWLCATPDTKPGMRSYGHSVCATRRISHVQGSSSKRPPCWKRGLPSATPSILFWSTGPRILLLPWDTARSTLESESFQCLTTVPGVVVGRPPPHPPTPLRLMLFTPSTVILSTEQAQPSNDSLPTARPVTSA